MNLDAMESLFFYKVLKLTQTSGIIWVLNEATAWKLQCLMENAEHKPQNSDAVHHLYKE